MIIFKNFKNVFSIPELRQKILFTLGTLVVFRVGTHIPVIGVNVLKLKEFIAGSATVGSLLSYIDTFSGGALAQCTLFALGIMPYITASIMMQILGLSVPYFEQLSKEGEHGKKLLNQYTKYLALALSVMYASGYAGTLEYQHLVLTPGWMFRIVFILSLSAGCMAVMWLGDQISLYGIGNGSSMIIFAGIVAHFPDHVIRTLYAIQSGSLSGLVGVLIWAFLIFVMGCIVFLEKGERRIPVQYARRVVGNRVYGGQSSVIPFKINNAGVMPVIFASTILNIPLFVIGWIAGKNPSMSWILDYLGPKTLMFNLFQFLVIVMFYYVYTAMVYNPVELADNIKKSGGFIPGVRPGRKTAEFFDHILTHLGLVGAVYLGVLALIPNIMAAAIPMMPFMIGGTSILIVVGVALETSNQLESYLIEHNYDSFLTTGKTTRGSR